MPTHEFSTSTQLIPLHQNAIGAETVQTVDARELHAFLKVETQYTHWIQRRIEEFGFLQDVDYVVANFGYGIVKSKDYFVTIDMAKELSMVERTPKGKEARRYFIECERRLLSATHAPLRPLQRAAQDLEVLLHVGNLFGTPLHIIQQEAVKQVEASTGVSFHAQLALAPAQHNIQPEDEMLEPTELAYKCGEKSAIAMNKKLVQLGLQEHDDGGSWIPAAKGTPLCVRHAWTNGGKTGYNWKWNVEALRRLLER